MPETVAPMLSDEAVTKATGRGWQEWFGLLDAWGAAGRTHPEMARWLSTEQGTTGWWAQSITVGYERARGRRVAGQRPDGWRLTHSITIAVPVERLFDAFLDESFRQRWLPGAELRLRRATAKRSARFDWQDGSTRVNCGFASVTERRSRLALQHERLPDADTADEMKSWWRGRVDALKTLLESEGAAG